MQLIEITTPALAREFLEMPLRIYKDDPNYIRPLDQDIEKVFSPERNKFFKHGELIRWILRDDNGLAIGRVAAFINKSAQNFEQPTGGLGFFECINDRQAAGVLFDACKSWLQERGMEAMDGPINFGERNAWWGLLMEGFTPPSYNMNYNPKYYVELFESYGFQVYFNQYSYGLRVNDERPEKYYERSKALLADPNYSFKHLRMEQLDKFTEDFRYIYNKAFVNSREGLKEMSSEQARNLMLAMKPVIVDYLIWYISIFTKDMMPPVQRIQTFGAFVMA